jgi:hypothetical protein
MGIALPLIMAGGSILGGVLKGKGKEKEEKERWKRETAEKKRVQQEIDARARAAHAAKAAHWDKSIVPWLTGLAQDAGLPVPEGSFRSGSFAPPVGNVVGATPQPVGQSTSSWLGDILSKGSGAAMDQHMNDALWSEIQDMLGERGAGAVEAAKSSINYDERGRPEYKV